MQAANELLFVGALLFVPTGGALGANPLTVFTGRDPAGTSNTNRFQQSARAGNRTAIGFAGESRDRSSPEHALRVEGNSFVNEGGAATFVRNHSSAPALLKDNRLPARGVTALRGPGHVD